MKKSFTIAVLIGLILFVLVGCGWHGTGKVVQKDYTRAWTQVIHDEQCTNYGTADRPRRICVPYVHTQYWPEHWDIRVKDEKDGKKHWVEVSEYDYNNTVIGSTFTNGED
jgi:hypothetical protein